MPLPPQPRPDYRRPRPLPLPAHVSGRLFLHSLPGRMEELATSWALFSAVGVTRIYCLVTDEDIHYGSPEYAQALADGLVPFGVSRLEIPDYGPPADPVAALEFVEGIAGRLHAGETALIHCGAGIGRTGMMATAVLMALGLDRETAVDEVRQAGSETEEPEQAEFLVWVERELAAR